jgi:hypothetical protein
MAGAAGARTVFYGTDVDDAEEALRGTGSASDD